MLFSLFRVLIYNSLFCFSTSSCNVILEAARRCRSPVIIRISHASGVHTFADGPYKKGDIRLDQYHPNAAVAGSVALALHVRTVAPFYGVPVILQSETLCLKRLVSWYEGLLVANESHFEQHGEPLYSSHLLDLTTDVVIKKGEDIAIAAQYLKRLDRIKVWLNLKVGGDFGIGPSDDMKEGSGVGDRMTPTTLTASRIWNAYETLSQISDRFSLAVPTGIALPCLGQALVRNQKGLFWFLDEDDVGATAESNNLRCSGISLHEEVSEALPCGRVVQVNVNNIDSLAMHSSSRPGVDGAFSCTNSVAVSSSNKEHRPVSYGRPNSWNDSEALVWCALVMEELRSKGQWHYDKTADFLLETDEGIRALDFGPRKSSFLCSKLRGMLQPMFIPLVLIIICFPVTSCSRRWSLPSYT